MTEPIKHTRWIGGRNVDIEGWKLAERNTQARSLEALLANDKRPNAGNWSSIEFWRLVEGSYIVFQIRMRYGRPSTFTMTGDTLTQLWNNLKEDYRSHWQSAIPAYWVKTIKEASKADRELDREAV